MVTRMGIIVGMASEARIAQRANCPVAVGGGQPRGAWRMAQQLLDDGTTALISFGLAGGLDPGLEPGSLLVPRTVLSQGRVFACDTVLCEALEGQMIERFLAWDRIVSSAAEKERLWQETGASAIDLESGAVAEVATARGVPFAVLRAVCDPATRELPSAAVEALDENGRIMPMKMAGILARHPSQIPDLIALGRDAARARKALIRGAEGLGRLAAGHANLGRLAF